MRPLFKQSLIVIALSAGLLWGRAFGQSAFDAIFNTGGYEDVIVQEVLKADTLVLQNERKERVKLIGLRAPEAPKKKKMDERDTNAPPKPVDPFNSIEEQALEFAKELLEGRHVRLEFDVERNNEDHAAWAYVFLLKDNTFVNAEILRQGFARLSVHPPNTKYADGLRAAYKEAQTEKRGLQGQ
jgi:micrococcal nuclease